MAIRLEDRVTEIYSSLPGHKHATSYGSGFLLGGGVILTAAHVVAPFEWGQISVELDITARPLYTLEEEGKWAPAELIWPSYQKLGKNGPDIALLRLTKPPAGMDESPLLGIDLSDGIEADEDYGLKVLAVGFPQFTYIKAQNRPDTHQISGRTKPYSGIVSKTYEIEQLNYGKTKNGEKVTTGMEWSGFSGAALLTVNRHLIGIVVATKEDGWFDFRAVRLDPFLAQKEFASALRGSVTNATEIARIELPPVEKLVCLLDRDNQEQDIIAAYKRCCPLKQSSEAPHALRPLICILPGAGEYRHLPEEMAERLLIKTLPKDLGWPSGLSFCWLDWPPAHLDTAEAVSRLRNSLWNVLCGVDDAPTDPAEFRKLWNDGSRSRLFHSDLTQLPLNHETAKVLAAWAQFWAELGPADSRPPFHLLLLGPTLGEATTWRALAPTAPGVTIEPLTELGQCSAIQLRRWLEDRLPNEIASEYKHIFKQLNNRLSVEFDQSFFLSQLKNRVRQLIEEMFHA